MHTQLLEQLGKAKIELMTRSVFISTIALSIKQVITASVSTAGTDNVTIYYNPQFIQKLSTAELAGLMAHECWHIAFQHIGRQKGKEPTIWNAAADFVINLMLVKGGFSLPAGGLIDNKYAGMHTEQVYNVLIKEGKKFSPGEVMLDILKGAITEDGEEVNVTDILVRAATQSKLSGKAASEIPGEIVRAIDELLNPKLPWQVLLNRFLDVRNQDEYSWNRRNRRHRAYLPSLDSKGLGHLTFAIDTSGSITKEELTGILSEIKGIKDTFDPERMTIIDCDSRIHKVHDVTRDVEIMDLQFTGGGGTRFKPVLNYMEKHPCQALIYFTDLYGEKGLPPVDYPILWICNSIHAPMNIGETIYL